MKKMTRQMVLHRMQRGGKREERKQRKMSQRTLVAHLHHPKDRKQHSKTNKIQRKRMERNRSKLFLIVFLNFT